MAWTLWVPFLDRCLFLDHVSEPGVFRSSLLLLTTMSWIWLRFRSCLHFWFFVFQFLCFFVVFRVSSLKFLKLLSFSVSRGIQIWSWDQGVVTKNWSNFTDFAVCVLSLRPVVPSGNSIFSSNFGLGPFRHFIGFSVFYCIGKILSWFDFNPFNL